MKIQDLLYLVIGSLITLTGIACKSLVQLHIHRLKVCWGLLNISRRQSPPASREDAEHSNELSHSIP